MTVEQVELAVYGEHVDVVGAESDAPSNLGAAGQPDVLVRVSFCNSAEWRWGKKVMKTVVVVAGCGQSEVGGSERDCLRE